MSRTSIPFSTCDISALARSLRDQLNNCGHTPGHVELLNMLARSNGHRNFQSLRAQADAQDALRSVAPAPEPVDYIVVKRLAGYFDTQGRLISWPAKSSLQSASLWVIWSHLAPRQTWTEVQLNGLLRDRHLFGDHALLRREMCDQGLIVRTPSGAEYRRVEQQPPATAIALIRAVARHEGSAR